MRCFAKLSEVNSNCASGAVNPNKPLPRNRTSSSRHEIWLREYDGEKATNLDV